LRNHEIISLQQRGNSEERKGSCLKGGNVTWAMNYNRMVKQVRMSCFAKREWGAKVFENIGGAPEIETGEIREG